VGLPDSGADDDIFPGGIHAAEHTEGIGPDRVGVDLCFERMDLSAPAFDDEIDFPAAFVAPIEDFPVGQRRLQFVEHQHFPQPSPVGFADCLPSPRIVFP